MRNKTKLTDYDMMKMFEELYKGYNHDIIIKDNRGEKNILINDYLKTTFYTYSLELKDRNMFESVDGFEFPNLDTWLNSMGGATASYGLVEIDGMDLTASEDIDMGSITSKITFIMPYDKLNILEQHLTDIRLQTLGIANEFVNQDDIPLTFYLNIGDLVYDDEPIVTPIGKTIIATLSFSIAYMDMAMTSNQNHVEISLNGTDFVELKYSDLTQDIIFSGKPNLMQNKPYASGTINANVSVAETITYWIYYLDKIQVQINAMLKAIIDDTDTYSGNINIPLWVREKIPTISGNTFTDKNITTKMVIVNYKQNNKNSDFINVSLSLNRYGK